MRETAGRGPQLRLGHLLIWIVGCASGLALQRQVMTMTGFANPRDRLLVIGSSILWAATLGTLLVGCGLMAYRRWRGDVLYPSRAGHWLLLRATAEQTVPRAMNPLLRSINAYFWVILAIDLAFLWGLRRRLPRHWVAVFLVSTLLAAAWAVGFWDIAGYGRPLVFVVRVAGAFLEAFTILWAIRRDRQAGAPVDGLHRLGVGLELALDTFGMIFGLLYLVL